MTLRTISEHGCFGGVQGFHAHASTTCAAEMRFSVYRPPQAKDGPVPAFLELRRAGFNVSIVMLYALEGALTDTHWLTVKRERKQELTAALQ